jgi:hypothetical protein
MARLRDTFARQVWLRDVEGDSQPQEREVHGGFTLTTNEMLQYLLGVPSCAVVFDSVGEMVSIRVVGSAGQHGNTPDIPAASYLCTDIRLGLQAAYLDYLAIKEGAKWTAVGGREFVRAIRCSW